MRSACCHLAAWFGRSAATDGTVSCSSCLLESVSTRTARKSCRHHRGASGLAPSRPARPTLHAPSPHCVICCVYNEWLHFMPGAQRQGGAASAIVIPSVTFSDVETVLWRPNRTEGRMQLRRLCSSSLQRHLHEPDHAYCRALPLSWCPYPGAFTVIVIPVSAPLSAVYIVSYLLLLLLAHLQFTAICRFQQCSSPCWLRL